MKKRIVICCDGTWNTPDNQANGVPYATNVVRIAESVKKVGNDGAEQAVYYNKGVGTHGGMIRRVFDGATGSGISYNIKEAYAYLVKTYNPRDDLYFFGFSRGAYTVRSLAGLIRNAGILRKDAASLVDRAYAMYKSRNPATHPREREATLFRKTYAVEDLTRIHFIGVWDTVGALGNPLVGHSILSKIAPSILNNAFHDTDLSSYVRNAYHALAIDEKRSNFEPTLWTQHPSTEPQVLEQTWFPGVHSDVGGGYPEARESDIPLVWMTDRARKCGLDIALTIDELQPHPLLHESRTFPYTLSPALYRPITYGTDQHESVDASAIERYNSDPAYRPPNLVVTQ